MTSDNSIDSDLLPVSTESWMVNKITGISTEELEKIKDIPRPKDGPYTPKIVSYIEARHFLIGSITASALTAGFYIYFPVNVANYIFARFLLSLIFLAIIAGWKATRSRYIEYYSKHLTPENLTEDEE